ncbi:hypothetical protein [Herpetosiphon geysericola]|nr:hypothetical protein [Herpetosiphon geysericola]
MQIGQVSVLGAWAALVQRQAANSTPSGQQPNINQRDLTIGSKIAV